MGVVNRAITFIVAWVLLYAIVYFTFMAPKVIISRKHHEKANNAPSNTIVHRKKANAISSLTDPFIPSDKCLRVLDDVHDMSVAVVIPLHDEQLTTVLHTVKSIFANSGDSNPLVVIVDDHSTQLASDWKELKGMNDVLILRTDSRLGIAGSKNFATQKLQSRKEKVDVLVFLECGSIVSSNWLVPIISTLKRHPKAVVYPAIDVLDDHSGKIIQQANAFASIDWSLKLKWEDIDELGSQLQYRHPLILAGATDSDEVFSPVAPTIYAVMSGFFKDMGQIATTEVFSYWGPDNIELSIRTWLCGGEVIRQPCSRVATRRTVLLHEDGSVITKNVEGSAMSGYTEQAADKDAMAIAELWLGVDHRESVFRHRFRQRVPYRIYADGDGKHPRFLDTLDATRCSTFDWYLEEVFPGLITERESVTSEFVSHLSGGHMSEQMMALTSQYNKKSESNLVVDIPDSAVRNPPKTEQKLKKEMQESLMKESDEAHRQMVMEERVCTDVDDKRCLDAKNAGQCTTNLGFTLFGCPKSCGFCGDDGKYCSDFYLVKCPAYAKEGKCTTADDKDWMETNCMRSCGICRRDGDPPIQKQHKPQAVEVVDEIKAMELADPTVSQSLWKSGKLPDPAGDPCALKGTEHAKLLDRIALSSASSKSSPRVFCGTYTMKEKHDNNVEALRSTWGKRCDGWMAFSTATDKSIPALSVPHEGPEAYDNMWQKSRSIWKYIASHYMQDYDWFLLGGDDMYYIMENLREYLGSDEIQTEKNKGKGMFVGRRFFPPKTEVFNSGGAGYLLDKVALQVLADNIDSQKCYPHQQGFWEDVNVANCLKKSAGILPFDTRDDLQRERFHPFQPGHHLGYTIPAKKDWYALYNPELKLGFECCSENSVSFHYCPEAFMKKMHSYIYHCKK